MSIFNFFNQNASKKEDINPGTTPNKQTENYSTLNTTPMDLFVDSNEPLKTPKKEAATGNRINLFLNRNFLTLGINDGFEYHSFDTFTKVKRKLLAEFQLIMDQEIQDKKERMLELRQLVIDVKDLSEAAKAKLEMVEIPGGEFQMGAAENEAQSEGDEKPRHRVRVSSLFMGRYEVTQAQWRIVMGSAPEGMNDLDNKFKGDNLPVARVSWNEAVEFCKRLSQKAGLIYRLPTEAEWEYACRAGTTTPFHFGATITPELVNYDGNYPYGNAPKGTYRERTTAVGSFGLANAFGLSDMHGNVLEWCQDWYNEKYYEQCQQQGTVTDPQGPSSGQYRALRGGSWYYNGRFCRSAFRFNYAPGVRNDSIGFRVVVSARTQ